jgi:dihydroxy-acid dehydratase
LTAARRSAAWLAEPGKLGFIARSHLRAMGLEDADFAGRPVVGIANSFSELNPCNAHLRDLAAHVARGVLQAGGLPLEFPTISPGEPLTRPSSMLLRNLMAMDVEETIRANPLDAVVLLASCDKTGPAQLMGAASADVPAILLTGGPMLPGRFRGKEIGSGTDLWRLSEEVRAGHATQAELAEAESGIHRSAGHCMTMGTASTMACLGEALGMQLPGSAAVAAVDARRERLARAAGRRAVAMADDGPRPSAILTSAAFANALRANAAIGGSTNAVLHLLALAGRAGVELTLDDVDRLSADVPLLVDLKPSGRHLMDALDAAGGMPAVLAELAPRLNLGALTVTGRTLGEDLAGVPGGDGHVVRSLADPVQGPGAGAAVLRGNLAPDGAVIKPSAASPELLRHRGPALVFDAIEDYLRAAADPGLPVTPDTVLVLRGAGPRGYPGMPEVGNLPLPVGVLAQGVRDMVRVSDARASGTAYGTIVLHVAPEAAVGGPLALVCDGDPVELDVAARRLHLDVGEAELARRRASWSPPPGNGRVARGWERLWADHVLQADRGVDLDVLVGGGRAGVPRRPF